MPWTGTSGKQQGPPPPGQDRPGTSGGQTPRTGAWGRNKEQEPPPPRQEHPGTSGGRTPRTGTSATVSKSSGQENEAVEKQRSGVEDEA